MQFVLAASMVSTGLVAALHRARVQEALGDPPCDYERGLVITPRNTVKYTNLAQGGPDHGAEGILYSNVLPHHPGVPRAVDLLVTSVGAYYPWADHMNAGVNGTFGSISLASGSTAHLRFTFMDRHSHTPVEVPPFMMTLANFEVANLTGVADWTLFKRGGNYMEMVGTTSEVIPAGGTRLWHAFKYDRSDRTSADFRTSMSMTNDAMQKSVFLQMKGLSEFYVTVSMSEDGEGPESTGGGYFKFTGSSRITCPAQGTCEDYACPADFRLREDAEFISCESRRCLLRERDTCCEVDLPELCTKDHSLLLPPNSLLYSNLGNKGPDFDRPEGILYHNIFPGTDEATDMEISAVSTYVTSSENDDKERSARASKNGLTGHGFGSINVGAGQSVDLQFTFLSPGTSKRKKVPSGFLFTIYDFDEQRDGGGKEIIRAEGFANYSLSADSSVKAVEIGKRRRNIMQFESTTYGTTDDNPRDPYNITEDMLRKTVTLEFPPGTSRFWMSLQATGGFSARNFEFNGFSPFVCPRKATCHGFTCPASYELRPNAIYRLCLGGECDDSDTENCCRLQQYTPAKCSTYQCPTNYELRTNAEILDCEDETCYHIDKDTCCKRVFAMPCAGPSRMSLDKLEWQDDCGNMQFRDVFPSSNVSFDMKVVRLQSSCQGTEMAKATPQPIAHLPAGPSSTNIWEFQLEPTSGKSRDFRRLNPYFFTLLNFTSPSAAGASVAFPGMEFETAIFDSTYVTQTRGVFSVINTARQTFTGSLRPLQLTPAQEAAGVSVLMPAGRSFQLKWTQSSETPTTLAFAGASTLTCPRVALCRSFECPAGYVSKVGADYRACRGDTCNQEDVPTCCECDMATAMAFDSSSVVSSNLGGQGPDVSASDQALILSNVFPESGTRVNLVITAQSQYYPNNATLNAMNGKFLEINVRSGSHVDLDFKLVEAATGKPYAAKPFFFSVLDLDEQGNGDARTSISVSDYFWRQLSPDTEVTETDGMFVSGKKGTIDDNPKHPMALPESIMDRSISFLLGARRRNDPSISSWKVKIVVGEGWAGRNVLFSGASQMTCTKRELCSAMSESHCPPQTRLAADADRLVCMSDTCTDEDAKRCCRDL